MSYIPSNSSKSDSSSSSSLCFAFPALMSCPDGCVSVRVCSVVCTGVDPDSTVVTCSATVDSEPFAMSSPVVVVVVRGSAGTGVAVAEVDAMLLPSRNGSSRVG